MSLGYISGTLPSEWETPFLVDLVSPKQWKTISTKELTDDGYVVYGANGKIGFYNKYTHESATLMITCRGATCGNLHISEPLSYINGNAMALDNQPTKYLNIKYLKYSLQARGLQDTISGSAQPQITKQGLEKVQIPLPTVSEQKIIAEKLDTLLAQIDCTKARLEQIPQILKHFRQAVLASVVCGKLSKNTGQWKTYLLKNICISISDGDHQAPPKSETGIPFLVISDVNKGQIDFENVSRWVPESYYESLKEIRKPFQNDILYTVTGSYGIPVIVNTTKPFCFQRHIAIIKPNSSLIDYKFLAFYLESPQIFKHASDVATGTAQKTVSLSSLRNFELSVPSLEEQAEIVRRVEQLFAYADTIEKQVNSALTRVNSLTQSILAKAFRGELTAQWRAENPDLISGENSAAALLEKIKAERAASGGKKASRKKA